MMILITGCDGQLGQGLQAILTSGRSEIGPIPEELEDCDISAVDVDELDITDTAAVLGFVRSSAPDVIINCAAMTNVNACESEQVTAMRVNAIGPRNLALAAEEVGAKLIHVSTDYVFRGNGTAPYCEWDETGPNTVYGKSKLLGEQYVLDTCHRAFVVRTAWLYGLVGNNFVKTMRRLGRERGEVTVVYDQQGNPTNANDLAHHLLKLAVSEAYGIYHCTGSGVCSWFDFACKIMEYSGIACRVNPCTTAEYPTPAPRPAYSALRNLMLESTVGDEMRPWEEALQSYCRKLNEVEQG